MEMNKMDAQQQLALIKQLAEDARGSLDSMVFPFLLFGTAVVIGTALSYLMGGFGYEKFIWIIWIVLMGGAGLIIGFTQKKQKHSSITDKLFTSLWGSIGLSMLVVMALFFTVLSSEKSFATMFVVMGLLLFIGYEVSGMLIRSKMMMFLGLFWIATGIICIFVLPLIAPLIFCGATVLLEIVPAIVIMAKRKKD